MRHCSSSINYGGKRGVAHLPPRVRLRDCGAWSSALLRNSTKIINRSRRAGAIPPPHMRGLELHAPTHCNPPPRWADACDRHPERSACVSDNNGQKKPLNRRWSRPIIVRRPAFENPRSVSGQHLPNAILVHRRLQMVWRAVPAWEAILTLADAAKPHVHAVILYPHVTLRGALRVLLGVVPVLGRMRCMGRRR